MFNTNYKKGIQISNIDELIKIPCSFHQKGQEMDKKLKEIRVEIHDMIWTLTDLKKSQMENT